MIPKSSIVLMRRDSYQSFHSSHKIEIYKNHEQTQPKFLIYCSEIDSNEFFDSFVEKKFSPYGNFLETFKYFIVNSSLGDGYLLATNFVKKNQPGEDFTIVPINVNFFDKKTLEWRGNFDDFKRKTVQYKNFTAYIQHFIQSNYFYYVDNENQDKGIYVDLFKIVGDRGGFNSIFDEGNKRVGPQPYGNPIITLSIYPVLRKYTKEYEENTDFFSSSFNIEEKFCFIITPNGAYSPYEKIIMPFDRTTWLLLMLTFLIAFIIVIIVNQLSDNVQKTIYGSNVRMPSYTIGSVFFGISLTRLAAEDFPRIIFMHFTMFCLVIRTAYQGVLYEFITTDVQKPVPKTITELLRDNYTFVRKNDVVSLIMQTHLSAIVDESIYEHLSMNLSKVDFEKFYLEQYENSSAKLAFYADEITLGELNYLCKCSNLVLDEVLFQHPISLTYFHNHNSFQELIEDTLQHIIPFGILQHSAEFHKWYYYGRYDKRSHEGPKVLTLEQLSFGFVLWLSACGISTIGFIMEQMHIKLRRHFRTLLGFILFFMLLNQRLKTCAYV